jgi:hypothetical protein
VRTADDIADARKVVNGADDLGDARRVASGADHGADAGRAGRRAEGAGKGARRAEDASGARRLDDGIGCPFRSFSPETLVVTASGLIPIDQVAPGTEVWAFDEETGERSLRKVSSTAFHLAEDGLLLTVGGETLRTTAEHPFFTGSGEWVEAARLQVGQEVQSLGGELLRVEKLEKRDGRFAVFNFEVDEDHSYFVGDGAVLVHNCGGAANPLRGNAFEREVRSALGATGKTPVTYRATRVTTIPDLPVGKRFGVADAKDVRQLTGSRQLRTQIAIAEAEGLPFSLFISRRTRTVSTSLRDAVRRTNGRILEFEPESRTFRDVVFGNRSRVSR